MYVDQVKNKSDFAKELGEIQAPLALSARLGGSTVDFAIAGLDDRARIYEISAPNQGQAVEVLFDVIRLVSEKAIEIGQSILPVTFGVAGSSTISEPNKYLGEPALPQVLGLHSLPNYSFNGSSLAEDVGHIRKPSLVNFYTAMTRTLSGLPVTLNYIDEARVANPIVDKSENSKLVMDYTVRNDTVSVAASCVDGLRNGDNVLGLVCGSGFNLGYCSNYQKGRFIEERNYEAGHHSIPLKFTSPLDLYISDQRKRTPEQVFAGGNKGNENKGIRMQLKFLREVLADPEGINYKFVEYSVLPHLNQFLNEPLTMDSIQKSPLIRADYLASNRELVAEAKAADPLALALCLSQAKRLGAYLAASFKTQFASALTQKLAITGSHFLDILSVHGAENLFKAELAKVRGSLNDQIQLVTLDKDRVDGMIELVESQSHNLRSSARATTHVA